MKELEDYAGEFSPRLQLEDFSKKTLAGLIRMYTRLYMALDGFWYLTVQERRGNGEALQCDIETWAKQGGYEMSRIAKQLGIKGNDVTAERQLSRAGDAGQSHRASGQVDKVDNQQNDDSLKTQGRNRKIVAAQPQGRYPDQITHDPGKQNGRKKRHRKRGAHFHGQKSGRVGTDPIKCAMTQRKFSQIAHDDAETDCQNDIDAGSDENMLIKCFIQHHRKHDGDCESSGC